MCMSSSIDTQRSSTSVGKHSNMDENNNNNTINNIDEDHLGSSSSNTTSGGSTTTPQQQQQQQQVAVVRGLPPSSVSTDSSSSSNSGSDDEDSDAVDDDDRDDNCARLPHGPFHPKTTTTKRETQPPRHSFCPATVLRSPFQQLVHNGIRCSSVVAAIIVAAGMTWFSLVLPFVVAPNDAVARQTYVLAQWYYLSNDSYFDNTIYTYGTDYLLAICMWALIHMIPYNTNMSTNGTSTTNPSGPPPSFKTTAYYTRGLLGSYMISVVAGGLAHQTFTTIAVQNTPSFRILWTICVGAVAIASAFMGAAATSLLRYDTHCKMNNNKKNTMKTTTSTTTTGSILIRWDDYYVVPIISVSFWFMYGICVTCIVIVGGFSFQRPACDIFVVGITQFPSTAYMMAVLYCLGSNENDTTNHHCNRNHHDIVVAKESMVHDTSNINHGVLYLSNTMKYIACCGFILNAPLLPLYPILVQYTGWSLGLINTLLHTWLLLAWTCQGLSLRHIGILITKTTFLQQHDSQVLLK